jgi:hypothetical protein
VPQLTLLLPPAQRFDGLALPPALARALGRADRQQHAAGEQAQLARQFRLLPDRWSHAALGRVADGDPADAGAHAWLRADPAYIRPDINGARLLGIGAALGIDQGDADALLPALRPLFGDAGFTLDAPSPQRWYLRLPRGAVLPAFASPEQALGDDVFQHDALSDGGDAPEARRWRRLSSEAQVVLHNHPHNAARLAAGKVPINALWFWGGGRLPDGVSTTSPTLHSDDPVLQGLARLGKLSLMPLTTFPEADTDALLDLRALRDPRALLDGWLLPATRVAARHAVTFDCADGATFSLMARQRWRVWRAPLATLGA